MRLLIAETNVESLYPVVYYNNFKLIRNQDEYKSSRIFTFIVKADSKRFGKDEIVYESHNIDDCADWICNACKFYMNVYDNTTNQYKEAKTNYNKYIKRPIEIDNEFEFTNDNTNINNSNNTKNSKEINKISPIIRKAVNMVNTLLTVDLNEKQFVFDDKRISKLDTGKGTHSGLYSNSNIILHSTRYTVDTVIHEIGHYIHDRYFGNQYFHFKDDDSRTQYSLSNWLEAFAVVFQQFVEDPGSDSPNVVKMKSLLKRQHLLRRDV